MLVVGKFWIYRDDYVFCICLLFLLFPLTCYSLMVGPRCKWIKERKIQRQKYFNTQCLFCRSTTISWWETFFPRLDKAVYRRGSRQYICIYIADCLKWLDCSPMVRGTWVQSQVASYQRFQKWYLIPPCLTLSNIKYVPRVKWSNPGKGAMASPTPRCSTYRKGSPLVALTYGHQLYFLYHC